MTITETRADAGNLELPVLTQYDEDHIRRIALPVGGIGTGTVSLGGRGNLQDFEIVNRPAKGFTPARTFFALYAQPEGEEAVTRVLEGQIDTSLYEGSSGAIAPNHGLPRFRHCSFDAAYPFGQVRLTDPDLPVTARLQAFNPLIPGDADRSSIPVAVLRYVLTNTTGKNVVASVCGNLQNFIGTDGSNGTPSKNINRYQVALQPANLRGIFMTSAGIDPQAEQWGTMALTVLGSAEISYRTAWPKLNWGGDVLDFWDDFSADGKLDNRTAPEVDAPVASLAARITLAPHETKAVTFMLTWHFPNRMTWTPVKASDQAEACCDGDNCCPPSGDPNRIGNYYTTRYADAWDVAVRTAQELAKLEAETLSFVRAFTAGDLPEAVKEAALNNLSALRSQTSFRLPNGYLFGWEGCHDKSGCCHGSCTHVWNYEQATPYLFGDLSRTMREVEFAYATQDNGHMSFRVNLPLSQATGWNLAAADGQMGCLMKLYRDWKLSGDDEMLRRLWPKARKALEFCWIPGGWDADRDGVMEGCQHNTMDVEYYGPNPQMGSWYLGALRATEEMARYLNEDEFAGTCHALFEQGSRWLDANLFNGEYYEHEIRPVESESEIAPGLRHESMGARDLRHPELQLGAGCLVDQLVGQYMAHVCGLGYLLDPANIRATLQSLMRYNFKQTLYSHFNYMRSYALGGESAMLMATYPRDRRPERPFPYSNEVMTGFEYTAGVHMLYEGQLEDGLRVISAVRERYDGFKRSPFDEAECGHHYARAMASWAGVLALTGFHYSGVEQSLQFAAATQPVSWFWSNGAAWGTCRQTPADGGIDVEIDVLHGTLAIQSLTLTGAGRVQFDQPQAIEPGSPKRYSVARNS